MILNEFEDYLQNLSHARHFLLINEERIIGGWAFSFDKLQERWFAIILSEVVKGQGLGRKMLDILKQREGILHGWVIDHDYYKRKNGQPYYSPIQFYKKCGFAIFYDNRLEPGKISAVKVKWKGKN